MLTIVSIAAGAGLLSGAAVEAIGVAMRYRKLVSTGLKMLDLLRPHYTAEEIEALEKELNAHPQVDFKNPV